MRENHANSNTLAAPRESSAGPPGSALRGWLALLLVLLGVVLSLYTGCNSRTRPRGVAERPEVASPPTPNVHVALHLDEPLVPDHTVVWTAAFQAAWDRLADTLGMPKGIPLAAPA